MVRQIIGTLMVRCADYIREESLCFCESSLKATDTSRGTVSKALTRQWFLAFPAAQWGTFQDSQDPVDLAAVFLA